MLVRKLKIVPIECIVRGYLAGSGWKEYHSIARYAASACRGAVRIRAVAGADFHSVDQSGERARHEYLAASRLPASSASVWRSN